MTKILDFFKKDSVVNGVLSGLLLPVLVIGIYFLIKYIIPEWKGFNDPKIPIILSIIPNLLLMRFQFINVKASKAARAVLTVSFVIVITVFLYFRS